MNSSGTNAEPNKKYSKLRLTAGFILGTAAYCIGFIAGGFIMGILNKLAFLPAFIDTFQSELTACAIAANLLAFFMFNLIDRTDKYSHSRAFAVWLIIIAVIYFILCIISGDTHLFWYPVISIIIIMAFIIPQREK